MGRRRLLMEIVTAPQPRDEPVVAGDKHRRGRAGGGALRPAWAEPNKLLARVGAGRWFVLRLEQALASRAKPVIG